MRKMATLASAVALLILAAGVFAPSARLSAGEEADLEKMISSAKTAANHEAIAAEYERAAAEAKAKSEKHRAMGEAYKKAGGALVGKLHIDMHCESLADIYARAAKENEVLAKIHHGMAKETK
jgi:hypothetical protein